MSETMDRPGNLPKPDPEGTGARPREDKVDADLDRRIEAILDRGRQEFDD